jgi:hypothetical protein
MTKREQAGVSLTLCGYYACGRSLFMKNPFANHENPAEHMVELLAEEAELAGMPLSPDEKQILRREASIREPVPEELRSKAKTLIEQRLKREQAAGNSDDPKSFNNSLAWAGEPSYPNIVALTEDVFTSGPGDFRLEGRRWIKDKLQLVGCAVVVILVVGLLVTAFSVIFHWK